MPEAVVHTFFVLSVLSDLWDNPDLQDREQKLSEKHYGLYPAFINGMLDAAGPGVTLTDGNEGAYYYTSTLAFYSAYHGIRQRALSMVAPENTVKYKSQVQVANALYVDHLFNLRTTKYLSAYMTPEQRARWFEHNVYYAMRTSDEFVWLYSERMNWWKNEGLPPGLEQAVVSACDKLRGGRGLGFEVDDVIQAAQEAEREAVRAQLTTRSADIRRRAEGDEPPEIDGDLSDEIWAGTPALEPFLPYLTATDAPPAQTEAHVAYDDADLYIAVRCVEPDPEAMSITGTKRDDSIWEGESVDVFLQPTDQAPGYYHFIVNPEGVVWDATANGEQDLGYNPDWNHATTIADDSWTLELAIPWSALKMGIPKPGTTLKANLCRQRMPAGEHSAWSQTVRGFVEPDSFGTWTLN